jgi:hypothetical protein
MAENLKFELAKQKALFHWKDLPMYKRNIKYYPYDIGRIKKQ